MQNITAYLFVKYVKMTRDASTTEYYPWSGITDSFHVQLGLGNEARHLSAWGEACEYHRCGCMVYPCDVAKYRDSTTLFKTIGNFGRYVVDRDQFVKEHQRALEDYYDKTECVLKPAIA